LIKKGALLELAHYLKDSEAWESHTTQELKRNQNEVEE